MELSKSSKRILIIDDEIEIGEMIQETLQEYYIKAHYISDASQVSAHLDSEYYDLILSDISMPKLDGPNLVALIRSKGLLTPVIFVTGNITLEYALMALRLGVADVVNKPFKKDYLLETINHVLELRKRNIQLYEKKRHLDLFTPESKMIGMFHTKLARRKAGGES